MKQKLIESKISSFEYIFSEKLKEEFLWK